MPKKNPAFTVVRLIATLVIVYYHFAIALEENLLPVLLVNSRSGLGFLFVSVFFILSGYLLHLRYPVIRRIFPFYRKRAASVFPDFYLVYAAVFLYHLITRSSVFAGKPLWTFVFTPPGLDGYLSASFNTWYLVGEWFLGAIILLYLLYPAILFLYRKSSLITVLLALFLYILFISKPLLSPSPLTNLFSCLISFMAGVYLAGQDEKVLDSNWVLGISAVLLAVFFFIPLHIDHLRSDNILTHAAAVLVFLVLYRIGKAAGGHSKITAFVLYLGELCYPVFLIHHILLLKLLHLFPPSGKRQAIVLLMITYILVFTGAIILKKVRSVIIDLIRDCFKLKSCPKFFKKD